MRCVQSNTVSALDKHPISSARFSSKILQALSRAGRGAARSREDVVTYGQPMILSRAKITEKRRISLASKFEFKAIFPIGRCACASPSARCVLVDVELCREWSCVHELCAGMLFL